MVFKVQTVLAYRFRVQKPFKDVKQNNKRERPFQLQNLQIKNDERQTYSPLFSITETSTNGQISLNNIWTFHVSWIIVHNTIAESQLGDARRNPFAMVSVIVAF